MVEPRFSEARPRFIDKNNGVEKTGNKTLLLEPLPPKFFEFEPIRKSIIDSIDRSINSIETNNLSQKDLEEILKHYHFGYIGLVNKEIVKQRLGEVKIKLFDNDFVVKVAEKYNLAYRLSTLKPGEN